MTSLKTPYLFRQIEAVEGNSAIVDRIAGSADMASAMPPAASSMAAMSPPVRGGPTMK